MGRIKLCESKCLVIGTRLFSPVHNLQILLSFLLYVISEPSQFSGSLTLGSGVTWPPLHPKIWGSRRGRTFFSACYKLVLFAGKI